MVVLKKIINTKVKASSLTEVIIATVIILVIFGIALLTIDNLLFNAVKSNTHTIENELTELVYQYKNGQVTLPYSSDENEWMIYSEEIREKNQKLIVFHAENKQSKKKITKKTVVYEN
ncbi:conserved hypothetical protein [Tenacibaculum sediminilitoris]|uniref:hypothetical protein n=1 Tax=Tenacibaculum sediminilitoris TaxID=1820334 RepID=UPI003895B3D2